jgi:type II secretory pathway pseudopilin PulG
MASDYSPPGPAYQPTYPKPAGDQTNVPGLIGFILALVGLFISCGTLAPIALILSIIGMRKEPKGLAIAGLILSILGLIELLIVAIYFAAVAAMFASCLGLAAVGVQEAAKQIETDNALRMAETEIENYQLANGELPDDVTGNQRIEHLRDGWKNKLRYERNFDEDGYDVISAGPDGIFDNFDDKTLEALKAREAWDEPLDSPTTDAPALDGGINLDAAPTDAAPTDAAPPDDSGTSVPEGFGSPAPPAPSESPCATNRRAAVPASHSLARNSSMEAIIL